MWHSLGNGWGWEMSMLGMTLLWVLLIVALLWGSRLVWLRTGPRQDDGTSSEAPLDVLKRRYARGEIDRAEFEEMKRNLQ